MKENSCKIQQLYTWRDLHIIVTSENIKIIRSIESLSHMGSNMAAFLRQLRLTGMNSLVLTYCSFFHNLLNARWAISFLISGQRSGSWVSDVTSHSASFRQRYEVRYCSVHCLPFNSLYKNRSIRNECK